MRAERSSSQCSEAIAALLAAERLAPGDAAWGEAFRDGFDRLYTEVDLHPAASTAAEMFEAAAATARHVAVQCLPLGIALVMHLYPLCALRCVPLPWWSPANLRRNRLLQEIQDGGLILANAGSERVQGAHSAVTAARTREGVLVNGTFDYVSLAHVADIVLFSADVGGHSAFCASEVGSLSMKIGEGRFRGSMRLSDTCPMTFENHWVPAERCFVVPSESAVQCTTLYQRSWFHLLLGEAHLARIEQLYRCWDLPRSADTLASLHELSFLRKYSLCLLEEASSAGAIDSLARVTAAMKLRISLLAQATAAAIRERDPTSAAELGYIRRQPTCDEKILTSIGGSAFEVDEREKLAS